jgi:hypothetical protein
VIAPTWLWLRRSTALRAFPALVAVHLVLMFTRSGWGLDRDWAFGLAAAGTATTVPLIAGVVAFDRARRFEPTLAFLSRCTVRGRAAVLGLVLASWLWAVAAWLVAATVAAVITWKEGAVGLPEPWTFVETLTLLAVAVAFGYCIGAVCAAQPGWSLAAAPVAAASILLIRILSEGLGIGVEGFLYVTGGGSTKLFVDRDAASAAALILVHVVVAIALIGVTLAFTTGIDGRNARLGVTVIAVALFLAAAANSRQVSSHHQPYQWTTQPEICLRGQVTICGPRSAQPILAIAQNSLVDAVGRLSGSGIAWQTRYVVAGGRPMPANAGNLNLDPEGIRDTKLSIDDLTSILVQPRLCQGLFDDREAIALIDDQRRVASWVRSNLSDSSSPADSRSQAAPADVRSAFSTLSTCVPMTGPMP